ncbi:MAG TPA: protease complex subunit PrcB family protein [Longimicrobium sp.]|nr:protease complex subunit PrcB family protein [Longimicrobium sp.]
MSQLGLSLAVAAALAGCAPAREAQTDAPSLEARTAMQQDSLPLRRPPEALQRAFRYSSGVETAMRETLRDATAWRALWTRLTSRAGPPVPPPEVDFAREMVLVAALGQRSSGGYAIRIESVRQAGGEMVATVVQTSPGPRCGVTGALTAPADVVIVPRSDAAVRWTVRETVTDCP